VSGDRGGGRRQRVERALVVDDDDPPSGSKIELSLAHLPWHSPGRILARSIAPDLRDPKGR
jgi:hypothetical protein